MKLTTHSFVGVPAAAAPAMAPRRQAIAWREDVPLPAIITSRLVAKGETVEVYLIDHHNKPMPCRRLQGSRDPVRRRQELANRAGDR